MTNLREAAQMALDVLIDAADSQSWEMQQNMDQHGEWYRRSVYLKGAVAKSQEAIESLRAALAAPPEELELPKVRLEEFLKLIEGKKNFRGIPLMRTEWPTREET